MLKRRSRTSVPEFLPFQHPKLVDRPPSAAGWLHEHKYDGYRMQVRVAGGEVAWRTREGHEWSSRFPDLSDLACVLPDCLLDGELCVLDPDGKPIFSALRSAVGHRQAGKIVGDLVFIAFDLLWLGERDLRPQAIEARKAELAAVLAPIVGDVFRLAPELPGRGAPLLDAACALRLEGIVSKRLGAPYEGGDGRKDTWLKSKCRPSGEVVIGGWREENGHFRSLLSGVMEEGKLRYTGRVHTGYSAEKLADLMPKLQALATDQAPFAAGDLPRLRGVHWVRPELVARVSYAEFTSSGKLRQASYHGLREDKAPEHVHAETEAPRPRPRPRGRPAPARDPPAVENPTKLLWPPSGAAMGVTKADLARYYEGVADWLLPYIRGRPCTVVIAPDGVDGDQTYVRHEGHWRGKLRTSAAIRHMHVPETGKTYPVFDTPEALAVAADIAVVELHPWNSIEDDPMRPGRLVFDIDPEPHHDPADVLDAARELRGRLETHGLGGFLKTSGKRGVRVVTPILQHGGTPATWAQAKAFGKRLCQEMAADSPDLYTVALPKAQRRGRIFLDYLRNDPGHHAASLLSPRTTATATVSMPLSWSQARAGLRIEGFTVATARRHLMRRDPWVDFDAAAAPLPSRNR